MARDLLPVPYCHVVFTLPSQLIPLAYENARLIYNLLFQAASEALLTIAGDPKRMGARVGFLAVLHTWNQKLGLHPHLHCLVPAGGLSNDRSRWIHSSKRFFIAISHSCNNDITLWPNIRLRWVCNGYIEIQDLTKFSKNLCNR